MKDKRVGRARRVGVPAEGCGAMFAAIAGSAI